MNIFQKISCANKLFKVIELVKELRFKEIKEGVDLIIEGINKIAEFVPELKDVFNKIVGE